MSLLLLLLLLLVLVVVVVVIVFVYSAYVSRDHYIWNPHRLDPQRCAKEETLLTADAGFVPGWMPFPSSNQQCQNALNT